MSGELMGWQPMLVLASEAIAMVVISVGVAQNLIYVIQLGLTLVSLAESPPIPKLSMLWSLYSEVALPISILVPAYNERPTIVESIRSLLSLQYPALEILVANDGSTDGTLETIIDAFGLEPIQRSSISTVPHAPIRGLYGSPRIPNLIVIDKQNGGKADALNAALNLARFPLFCGVDADSILEADSLLRAVQPFIDDPSEVIVVGGTIRVANGCTVESGRIQDVRLPRSLLPLFQTVEYLRAFLIGRLAWSRLRSLTLISGAFGIFRRSVVVAVGGYSLGTVGEDLEIIVKIHRFMRERGQPYRISYVLEPVCWTEVPSTWRSLARQRIRWQRGTLETFFKHARMLFNPRYGRVGTLGLGNMFLTDVLGPPIELIGYIVIPLLWAVGALDWSYFAAFVAVFIIFGIFISVSSLIIEEVELHRYPRSRDLLILTAVAILENFGYRQINNIWRIIGYWKFLRGDKTWGHMTRRGFGSE